MIYFLYGTDSFQIRAKVLAIKTKFLQTHKQHTITESEAALLTPETLGNLFYSQSLLGEKQLVIIKNLIAAAPDLQSSAVPLVRKFADDSNLTAVFIESGEVNLKEELAALLSRPGFTEHFETTPASQTLWVKKEIQNQGLVLTDLMVKKLITLCGSDQWRISAEINKLANLAKSQPITELVIEEVVTASSSSDNLIFAFTDAIAAGNHPQANRLLVDQLEVGEEPLRILATLATQTRNLIRVADLIAAKKSVAQIITITKLHPFVVRKLSGQAGNLPRPLLISLYSAIRDADWELKHSTKRPADTMVRLVFQLVELTAGKSSLISLG